MLRARTNPAVCWAKLGSQWSLVRSLAVTPTVDFYQNFLRPLLFSGLKADPEWLHQRLIQTLHALSRRELGPRAIANGDPVTKWIRRRMAEQFCFCHAALEQTLWGLEFPNPVGLAAGFDKDGLAAALWADFGFGFAELGTVTLHAQPGNPRPRLFRLPQDWAALNRMGFNNQGAMAMAAWLTALRDSRPHTSSSIPLGINLGKSKVTPLEEAAEDYLGSFRLLKELGDYFVVNVSSPNTPGLRSLQDASQLDRIFGLLQQENLAQKPLLVKIAPDLEWEAIDDILAIARTHHLAGIIATNTTIRRDNLKTHRLPGVGTPLTEAAGGISGAPLRQRSTDVIRYIAQKTQGELPIIGVGGIFSAADAWEKLVAGASLVQVYTGWFYEGPGMVRRILEGLVQKLEEAGLETLTQVRAIRL